VIDLDQILTAGIAQSQLAYVNTFYLTNEKLNMNFEYSVMPAAGQAG
jgi:hypothetical protein